MNNEMKTNNEIVSDEPKEIKIADEIICLLHTFKTCAFRSQYDRTCTIDKHSEHPRCKKQISLSYKE